jgi:hypothetical protein
MDQSGTTRVTTGVWASLSHPKLRVWKRLPSGVLIAGVASLLASSQDVAVRGTAGFRCASRASRNATARPTGRTIERTVRSGRTTVVATVPRTLITSRGTTLDAVPGRWVRKAGTPRPSGLLCARSSATSACAAELRAVHLPEIMSSLCRSEGAMLSPTSNRSASTATEASVIGSSTTGRESQW